MARTERARELRAEAWTLQDIATELGVAKASVSVWVRDVEFQPNPRRRTRAPRPSSLRLRKLAEIDRCDREGVETIGRMTPAGVPPRRRRTVRGGGRKTDGAIKFANTDPRFDLVLRHMVAATSSTSMNGGCASGCTCTRVWISRPHSCYWSELTGIPPGQFIKPYRAVADASRRRAKHPMGARASRIRLPHSIAV